jgi:hypothetical protein
MFRSKRGEIAGGCRRWRAEDVYNMYSLPDVVRMIKSWRDG